MPDFYAPQPQTYSPGHARNFSSGTYEFEGAPPYDAERGVSPIPMAALKPQRGDLDMPPRRTPSPTPSEVEFLADNKYIDYKKFIRKNYWTTKHIVGAVIILISLTLGILFSVYQKSIIAWMMPAIQFLHNHWYGWLIISAVIIVLSFPPLIGRELAYMICGMVWGTWIGFAIVTFGSLIGDLLVFFVFKYWCRARAEKVEQTKLFYGCFARVMRDGGLLMATIGRYTTIPPHFITVIYSTCGMHLWVFFVSNILGMPNNLIQTWLGSTFEEAASGEKPNTLESIMNVLIPTISISGLILAMWLIHKRMQTVKHKFIHDRQMKRLDKERKVTLSFEQADPSQFGSTVNLNADFDGSRNYGSERGVYSSRKDTLFMPPV